MRALEPGEALQVAELQAARLLELTDNTETPLDWTVIAGLPRIRVRREELPTSGMSFWDGRSWIIVLNASEPRTRQRFTLLHEYKHIVDHGATDRLYPDHRRRTADDQAEQAADYFAGCTLMPKRLLKRLWGRGVQRPAELARYFDVSERAITVRLAQLGLSEPQPRCTPPSTSRTSFRPRRAYYRQLSPSWLRQPAREGVPA
ncbi:ImmA/IrrE family metallo-endopeptidase [Geodermatophilus sp. SYSU D01119]